MGQLQIQASIARSRKTRARTTTPCRLAFEGEPTARTNERNYEDATTTTTVSRRRPFAALRVVSLLSPSAPSWPWIWRRQPGGLLLPSPLAHAHTHSLSLTRPSLSTHRFQSRSSLSRSRGRGPYLGGLGDVRWFPSVLDHLCLKLLLRQSVGRSLALLFSLASLPWAGFSRTPPGGGCPEMRGE